MNLELKRGAVALGVARSLFPLSSLAPGAPSFLMPAEAETALEEHLPVAKGETTT